VKLGSGGTWSGSISGKNMVVNVLSIDVANSPAFARVRISENGGSCATVPTGTLTIQAESYSNSFGVVPKNTGDVAGGQNVGNINIDDWMSYPALTIPTTGGYTVSYRVMSLSGGDTLQLERAGGMPVYGTLSIPSMGAWQAWTTVLHTVNLSTGSQSFALKAMSGGWNINWFSITPAPTINIQAESYSNSVGVVPKNTVDVGGGQNVGNINTDNWISYPAMTIPATGTYTVAYRVVSLSCRGTLQLERAGGMPVYGTLSIPSMGAWQTWTTVLHTVNLSAGSQSFALKAMSGGWNINWFSITPAPTITLKLRAIRTALVLFPKIRVIWVAARTLATSIRATGCPTPP
jgi:endoglucanase